MPLLARTLKLPPSTSLTDITLLAEGATAFVYRCKATSLSPLVGVTSSAPITSGKNGEVALKHILIQTQASLNSALTELHILLTLPLHTQYTVNLLSYNLSDNIKLKVTKQNGKQGEVTGREREAHVNLIMPLYMESSLEMFYTSTTNNGISLFDSLRFFGKLMEAVIALHDLGYRHNDLKCSNVLLSNIDDENSKSLKHYTPKLTDFGSVSSLVTPLNALWVDFHSVNSTASIRAPELWEGYLPPFTSSSTEVDVIDGKKSDAFSLSCILFQILYHCEPFNFTVGKMKLPDFYPNSTVRTSYESLIGEEVVRSVGDFVTFLLLSLSLNEPSKRMSVQDGLSLLTFYLNLNESGIEKENCEVDVGLYRGFIREEYGLEVKREIAFREKNNPKKKNVRTKNEKKNAEKKIANEDFADFTAFEHEQIASATATVAIDSEFGDFQSFTPPPPLTAPLKMEMNRNLTPSPPLTATSTNSVNLELQVIHYRPSKHGILRSLYKLFKGSTVPLVKDRNLQSLHTSMMITSSSSGSSKPKFGWVILKPDCVKLQKTHDTEVKVYTAIYFQDHNINRKKNIDVDVAEETGDDGVKMTVSMDGRVIFEVYHHDGTALREFCDCLRKNFRINGLL